MFTFIQFIENLANLKPIEVGPDGCATFSIDMDLIEQSSRIFLYKVRLMDSGRRLYIQM